MASRLRRRVVVIPAALVLLAGGGAAAWASGGRGGSGYRTAQVTRADVDQLLTLTGTVSAVEQRKVRFRTTGTVSRVAVTVGQRVRKGQVLATMASASLDDAVVKAEATLARAQATLETDTAAATAASPTPTPSATRAPSAGGSSLADAQQGADRALRDAQRALEAATRACTAPPSSTPSPTASSESAAPSLTCADALASALKAQQLSAAAQAAVARALSQQDRTSSANATPSSASDRSDKSDGSDQSGSTAGRLTRDRAAVSAAQVVLDQAEQDRAAASLTAPIAGTVASVPWTTGGTAATTDALVLLGGGAVDVTVDVPAASIRSMRVGLPATARADGSTRDVQGTVTAVGLLPTTGTSGSSSSTTYPVTVRVPAGGAGLVDGSSAAVSIVVKTVRHVLTVPNSALHDSTVTVLAKGKTTTVRVETGAVGALRTQVTSGLSLGQTVVVADLGEALPTSSTTGNHGGFGGDRFVGPPDGFDGGKATVIRRG